MLQGVLSGWGQGTGLIGEGQRQERQGTYAVAKGGVGHCKMEEECGKVSGMSGTG